MRAMDNVVRIPIGGGEGSGAAAEPPRQPSPPPDLLTVAARAAVGLVALAVTRRLPGRTAAAPG